MHFSSSPKIVFCHVSAMVPLRFAKDCFLNMHRSGEIGDSRLLLVSCLPRTRAKAALASVKMVSFRLVKATLNSALCAACRSFLIRKRHQKKHKPAVLMLIWRSFYHQPQRDKTNIKQLRNVV